jgi:DedD protein
LIGAIALVMVLVVFVPMLLDSEPRPTQPVAPIPSKDNAPPLPAPAPAPPVAKAPVADPAKVPEATKAAEARQASPEPPKSAVAKAAAPSAAVHASTQTPTPTKAAPTLEGFAVQVGAFRDEAKLKQARDKLAAAGVVHYTERLDSPGGALTRLRAGPFATREAAESAQASLKRVALEGKVVPLP